MPTAAELAILAGNEIYASKFTEADASLPLPPGKKYAIVTCQDARLHPTVAFGLSLGDAHVIRNAGGDAKDAIRSLVISQQMLGTKEIFLIKHTDCGMLHFENKDLHDKVKKDLGVDVSGIDYNPWKDIDKAVREDVAWLKAHELIPADVKENISGWIYDVKTGKISKVV